MAIIAVLAGLLLPALGHAKGAARRAECLSHLRQINMAVHLYAEDHSDTLPLAPDLTWNALEPNHLMIFYKRLVKSYLGLQGASSPRDKVFTCPADTFYYDWPSLAYKAQSLHDQPATDYSSYAFNGSAETNPAPPAFLNEASYGGLGGWKLAAIKEQGKTVLVMELSAGFPWSWHEPQRVPAGQCGFGDAKNLIGFVDGHVSYVKMFRNPRFNLPACNYEPPPGYDYRWHGD